MQLNNLGKTVNNICIGLVTVTFLAVTISGNEAVGAIFQDSLLTIVGLLTAHMGAIYAGNRDKSKNGNRRGNEGG